MTHPPNAPALTPDALAVWLGEQARRAKELGDSYDYEDNGDRAKEAAADYHRTAANYAQAARLVSSGARGAVAVSEADQLRERVLSEFVRAMPLTHVMTAEVRGHAFECLERALSAVLATHRAPGAEAAAK